MKRTRATFGGVLAVRSSVHSRWSLTYWLPNLRRRIREALSVEGGLIRW